MHTPRILQCAGAFVAVAIVSACATNSPAVPQGAGLNASYVGKMLFLNGRPTTAAGLNPLPSYSRLVPLKKSMSKDYEYIFNTYGTYAGIFDYPKSAAMIGKIKGLGGQGCTNVLYGYGKGIFWNAGRTNNLITEYKVGSNKVLKTLSLSYMYTSSCAMNTSGDIAIGVLLGNSSYGGQVAVFKNASGSGTVYQTPLGEEYFDGYDPSGNLFADGFALGGSGSFMLVELPKGSSKAIAIKTSNSPEFPGSVQWDGTYLTVFDQRKTETYRYAVSGTTATLKNTITYSGAGDCAQTWLVKGLMYCGDYSDNQGLVYGYPGGGAPIATFSGDFDGPLGVTAAKK